MNKFQIQDKITIFVFWQKISQNSQFQPPTPFFLTNCSFQTTTKVALLYPASSSSLAQILYKMHIFQVLYNNTPPIPTCTIIVTILSYHSNLNSVIPVQSYPYINHPKNFKTATLFNVNLVISLIQRSHSSLICIIRKKTIFTYKNKTGPKPLSHLNQPSRKNSLRLGDVAGD